MVSDTLIQDWLCEFAKQGGEYLRSLLNCSLPRILFLERYKSIDPISAETLCETLKFVDEIRPNQDEEHKKEDAILIYTIGTLL